MTEIYPKILAEIIRAAIKDFPATGEDTLRTAEFARVIAMPIKIVGVSVPAGSKVSANVPPFSSYSLFLRTSAATDFEIRLSPEPFTDPTAEPDTKYYLAGREIFTAAGERVVLIEHKFRAIRITVTKAATVDIILFGLL